MGNAVVGGVAKTGQYAAQDRLLAYGSATYQYNASGTLTNKTDGGLTTDYNYDARGSLLLVRPGTNVIAYTVDALGRRIARTKNGATTQRFIYQGFLAPAAELNADGSVATRFVYATRANVPDYMVRSGITYRIITDIRGSVRLVVNASTRVIVQRLDYDEWGRVLQDTNPGFQPFGFAGGLYDSDTGLVRFGFRDYDPDTGRWLAKDPILFNGGQANLYLYCANNPVNFVDPTGEFAVAGAIFGGLGGFASDILMQAAGNLASGQSAFSDIQWGSAFTSAGIGAGAGAIGVGVFQQGSKGLKALKTFRQAQRNLKAREAAMAAGKFRNPAKTAAQIAQRNQALKDIATATALGSTAPAVKAVAHELIFDEDDSTSPVDLVPQTNDDCK